MDFRLHQTALSLDGEWSLAFSETPPAQTMTAADVVLKSGLPVLAAVVPGNFELDLQANGVIEDPFFGMNIAKLRRYESAHLWYFRTFEVDIPPNCMPKLIFDGLDCFAEVYLNGELLGRTDNMLVEHLFSVPHLRQGKNELLVHIRPAVDEARRHDYPPALFAAPAGYDSLYVRKAPHMYGWDIMPRALSGGIWRSVKLLFLSPERLKSAYLETLGIAGDRSRADFALHVDAKLTGTCDDLYEVEADGKCGESVFRTRQRVLFGAGVLRFGVEKPRLWQPLGRGAADLYDVKVRLLKNGKELDSLTFRHGIRTVELERTEVTDSAGGGEFCFRVNGERLFVKGTNWVPVDAYHSRDAERIPQILEMAVDLGCNMIRCWGGNVYENDLFYNLCDEHGILIWQDFAMACAVYPQDAAFQHSLAIEARKVVRRLRQHPCVALWAGDNECDQAYAWGGRRRDPNTNVLTRQVLPGVLRDEDPTRPYMPSSPYIGPEAFRKGDRFLAEDHLWGPRDYYKSRYYTGSLCHFASEMGYHGCPSPDSLRKFLSPDKVRPYQDNEEWVLHSTSPVPGMDIFGGRVQLMADQIRELFGEVPDNLEDFAFASQASQAEAKKFFVEMFRAAKWRRTGVLWWNLMDGWPQLSDAVVDYYFAKKLAYGYIRRSQAPLCLTLREPESWGQEIVACNDTRESLALTFKVKDVETDEVVAEGSGKAAADAVTVLGRIPFSASAKRCYALTWSSGLGEGRNHYLAGNPPFTLPKYREWLQKAGVA